jgi:hypothetical protein
MGLPEPAIYQAPYRRYLIIARCNRTVTGNLLDYRWEYHNSDAGCRTKLKFHDNLVGE